MKTEKETEIIERCQEYLEDSQQALQEDFQMMEKCQDFKVGDQYDRDVLNYNKAHRKHSLTINRILPIINHIVGTQAGNPKEMKVYNLRGGSYAAAQLLTHLAVHAADQAHLDFLRTDWFDDGATTGKGYLGILPSYEADPLTGDLLFEKLDPFHVFPDPNCRSYNLNTDAEFLTYERWESQEKIEGQYPGKKKDIMSGAHSGTKKSIWAGITSFLMPNRTQPSGYGEVKGKANDVRDKYRYQVRRTWWKDYQKVVHGYRNVDGDWRHAVVTKASQRRSMLELAKARPQEFQAFSDVQASLRYCKWIGDTLLDYSESPFASVIMFPIVPFYAYHQNGHIYGVVKNLIGPQEEMNWGRSQRLNILKRIANTGWIVNALPPAGRRFLESYGHEDGIALDKSKFGGGIEKMDPNPFPGGHELIAQDAAQDMTTIANVRTEQPEGDQKELSGRAIALKQQGSLTGSGPIFSNFDHSNEIATLTAVEFIRNLGIYDEAEIRAIVDMGDVINEEILTEADELLAKQGYRLPPPPTELVQMIQQAQGDPQLAAQVLDEARTEIETYQQLQQEYGALRQGVAENLVLHQIESLAYGKLGVRASQSANAPTLRLAQFAETMEVHAALVNSNQPGIAREDIIEASDIANKDAIKANPPQQPQPEGVNNG